MRILAIRLRNLNSLAGSWTIDFTAPEYAASGIFAITGPTGAGKSTILDAVCLALFARTPRLGHISKSSNEILSRRAGDCFAEVEFETRQGRYRCHWGQHRARRSAEGELQPPRHEIVDARSGKVLETRSKEVGRLVEQVTGMDYDRFTRSILLAQGDFAAFLEADADQRAPILEQITGTGIYSRISIAVHERTSEERRKAEQLREALGAVVLLGDEAEQELEAGIGTGTAAVAGVRQRLALLAAVLQRVTTIESLQGQIRETDQQLLNLAQRREEARGELEQCDRGQRAQPLLGDYNRLTQVQDRMAALGAKGEELRAVIDTLQQQQRQIAEDHGRACHQLHEMGDIQSRENETIKVVRTLDLHIHEKKRAIAQVSGALRQAEEEREHHQQDRRELERQQAETAAQLEQLDVFFQEHAGDSLLVEHLAGFRQQLLQLGAREIELARLAQNCTEKSVAQAEAAQTVTRLHQAEEQAHQAVAALRQRQQQLQAESEEHGQGQPPSFWRLQVEQEEQRLRQLEQIGALLARQQAVEEERATLGGVLRELQAKAQHHRTELQALEEQRHLQQQLVAAQEQNHQLALRIHSYEEDRARLEQDVPCPLCGALHHPWADERPAVETSDEILTRSREALERLLAAINRQRETLVGLTRDIEHAGRAMDNGEKQWAEGEGQLKPLLPLLGDGLMADRATQTARLLGEGRELVATLRQRLQAIERLESAMQTVRNQLEQAMARHTDLLQQVQAARHAGETIASEMKRLEEQAQAEDVQINVCRAALLGQLQPLGISECPPQQTQPLLLHLETRQQVWKEQQQRHEQLVRHRTHLQAQMDKVDLLLATLDKTLSQQVTALEDLRREEGRLRGERFELYGDRDPNLEEQKLKALIQQAEARELVIRNRLTGIDKELHGQSEQARMCAEEWAALQPQSRALAADLHGRLPAAGFEDMAAFCAALLPPEALAELGRLKEELDREQAVLASRRAELAASLEREAVQQRGQKDQAELIEEQQALTRELEALLQRIGADRERLAVNSQYKQQFEEQQQVLAAQHKELERWELLHQLIGSADGKKFRVFAQGLTFDAMISHANRQLRKMNDRYILLRDPKEPLALQVIDNYQAGETRSTRNLSGGESFLVSLALSLGLSAMASHNVRVDSLFLDEGFGTLDEEALDTALQTLAELQQDGKLIGIISHVPMLKDRIDLRIQVLPGPGGNSRLLGPGCRHSS
jgi:exonuclease SbcC